MLIFENQNKYKNFYNNYNDDGENNINVKFWFGFLIV